MSTFGKVSCGMMIVFIVFSLVFQLQILNSKIHNLKSVVEEQGEILDIKNQNIDSKDQCINALKRENVEINKKLKEMTSHSVTVTAYTARYQECDATPDKTALMSKVRPGIGAAVSRDLIHLLGKKIYIEGVGVREVDDLMNSRWENKIDILVGSLDYAREFGIKDTKVVVLN